MSEHGDGGEGDGTASEGLQVATITCSVTGPYRVDHLADLRGTAGEALEATSPMDLCACGASLRKPFCDGSHHEIAFVGARPEPRDDADETRASAIPDLTVATSVTAARHGPLKVKGPVELVGFPDAAVRGRYALCRCGESSRKPFCDGSHARIDFKDPEE